MKNLSKVLAVVLAFAMVLSMVGFAGYTDVAADDNYAEAVSVLSALDILKGYEDGSFKPEATITRAEFATVVIRMLGLADSATGGSTFFTDVAADHWANGAIALAAQQGIVNGYGNGKFGPEDPVKYEEAIKMVVAALGYTPMADANGGYPGGYQVVAAQKGILANITGAKVGEPANRGVVAMIAYNSLPVPLMSQTGYGTQTNFETVRTLLLDKLNITKFEGVVDATTLSDGSLDAGEIKVTYEKQIMGVDKAALAQKVTIKGAATGVSTRNDAVAYKTYKIAAKGEVEDAAKALIDVASVMYVKYAYSTEDAELLCILKDGNKNTTVSFVSEDIKDAPKLVAGTDTTVDVWLDKDAGEYEEYALDVDKVYVNGRENFVTKIDTYNAGEKIDTDAEMKAVVDYYLQSTKAVDVTLLSNGADDEEFNTVYITSYEDVQVTRIANRTYKLSYKNLPANTAGTVILDETDKDLKFEIYKDGKPATFDDIKVDDVLSIAGYKNASNELEYGRVYIISDRVEGKVTAKSTNKVSIDGKVYKTNGLSVSLGDTATFFKNYRGILVAVDTTASAANVQYGFATYIRMYDADYGTPAQIRVLTAEGKWATIDMADSISINGAGRTASKNIDWTNVDVDGDKLAFLTKDGTSTGAVITSTKYGVNDVVAYDLNSDGKVAKLYFKDVANVFESKDNSGNKPYDADTVILGDIFMDDDTVLFSMDTNFRRNRYLDTDEKDVSVLSVNSLTDGEKYNVSTVYDEDDAGIASAILGYEMAAGISYADNFFVVTDDPMEATNEDGDTGIILTGIKGGEEVTLFINTEDLDCTLDKAIFNKTAADTVKDQLVADSTITASDFGKGDVLLYTLNSEEEAAKVVMLVDASTVAQETSGKAHGYLNRIDDIADNSTVVATVDTGKTNYKFVTGYASEFLAGGNLTMYSEGTSANTYAFASDVIGTLYDKYIGEGRVTEAMTGDITTDSNGDLTGKDGDIVFARVVGSRIVEFVVVANDR